MTFRARLCTWPYPRSIACLNTCRGTQDHSVLPSTAPIAEAPAGTTAAAEGAEPDKSSETPKTPTAEPMGEGWTRSSLVAASIHPLPASVCSRTDEKDETGDAEVRSVWTCGLELKIAGSD